MPLVAVNRNNPVRTVCTEFSTYHYTAEGAFDDLCDRLAGYGIVVDGDRYSLDPGPTGRMTFDLYKNRIELGSVLVFAWHYLSSGKVEITCYIS